MSDIVWEDPPPPLVGRPSTVVEPLLAALRVHPGKWAIAKSGLTNPAYGALGKALRERGVEITQRKQRDGTWTLYARWPEDAS